MMRKQVAVVAAVAALAVGPVVAGCGGEAEAETQTKTCPEGQVLVGGNAGGFEFSTEKQLPPGNTIKDTEGGSVLVTQTRTSATVEGNVPLTIECR